MKMELQKYFMWDICKQIEFVVYEGEIWYKYDVITSIIGLGYNDCKTDKVYKDFIQDNEKRIFTVNDRHGNPTEEKFINSIGHYKLLDRNEKFIKQYRGSVLAFEKEMGFVTSKDNNSHCTKTLIVNLEQAIINDNNEQIKACSKALINTPKIQQIKNSNPMKEELVDKFREEVYEYDDVYEVEWNFKMIKKDNPNEDEERISRYIRHRDKESTCPSWLKDVIK